MFTVCALFCQWLVALFNPAANIVKAAAGIALDVGKILAPLASGIRLISRQLVTADLAGTATNKTITVLFTCALAKSGTARCVGG